MPTRVLKAVLALLFLALGVALFAQDTAEKKPKSEFKRISILANAQGTSTQMGTWQDVRIIIEELSTEDDQQTLINAFKNEKHEGVVEALEKMKPKGRLSIPSRVGNDVKYIRELPSDKGRRYRLVTDRNIPIVEARNNPRSRDYSISAVELVIMPNPKESYGTLLPACRLKLNKQKEIEIEAFQNPWKLTNFMVDEEKEKNEKD